MLMAGGLASGFGAQFGYGCRPESALAFVLLSYEAQPGVNLDQVSRSLTSSEASLFGYSIPQCAPYQAPAGITRALACTSNFHHRVRATQNALIPGRSRWIVGANQDFFFVATTVCAGAQCDQALPAFEAFVAQLDFSKARAP
jgi:hypothetical protein